VAFDLFVYRVKKYIGSYVAALNGLDVLVFTGGIGENEEPVRKAVCADMDYLGIAVDPDKNLALPHGGEGDISAAGAHVKTLVVPTDEEYMIAADTVAIVSKLKK
jgi:acetate kinase